MRAGSSSFLVLLTLFLACGGTSRRTFERGDDSSAANGGSGGTISAAGGTTHGSASGGTSTGGGISTSGGTAPASTGGSTTGGSFTGGTSTGGSSIGGSGAIPGTGGTRAAGGTGAVDATGGSSNGGEANVAGEASSAGGSSGKAGSGGTGGSSGAVTNPEPITSCTDDFPFLGTWQGDILDFFYERLDTLTLKLAKNDAGDIGATIVWGDTPEAVPPIEGPDVAWPPGYFTGNAEPDAPQPDPWPGFVYTVVRGAGCDASLRFSVSTRELWQDWCELQTPVYTPEYGWGCTLQGGGSSDGMTCTVQPGSVPNQTYPLWKCEACGAFNIGSGVCACDETGCFANLEPTHVFDLTYAKSDASEILSGPDPSCGDCTVRLERQ